MAKNKQSVTEVKIKVLSEEDLKEPLLSEADRSLLYDTSPPILPVPGTEDSRKQDEDEKNKTDKYVPLPTPELKEVLMDYGYSGVKAGDMMEVIRKRYADGSIYGLTGVNDSYYEGYLNGSKELTYLPQYIFSVERAEPEKYSRRRTPKKWTENKLRKGKHSAKEKLKKGTRWAKRQMGIQGGGQRKRRRRSKLTRGKHKTKKHKTRKKTRKRIKSRRP